jgi:hypothetical protein
MSEDSEQPSFFEIRRGEDEDVSGQLWNRFELHLEVGTFKLRLPPLNAPDSVDCLFCRQPHDEVKILTQRLDAFLSAAKKAVLFEPSEPTFELSIKQAQAGGAKVEIWLDAGNAHHGIYRWDALGMRFQTDEKRLSTFLSELRSEFGC